jgi:phage terminase small subunit
MTILANAKHEAVAQAFIADRERVGARAYRNVYPTCSQAAAEVAFSRLLRNAKFSARIAELAQAAADGAVMTARQVLEELTKIARANMLDYMRVGPDGDPVLNFADLTRDQAAVLAEVTVEEFVDSRAAEVLEPQGHGGALKRSHGREVRRVKFKLADKIEALELLGKHHKLYVDRHLHDFGSTIAERLATALARADDPERGGDVERRSDHTPPRHRPARRAARRGKRTRAR